MSANVTTTGGTTDAAILEEVIAAGDLAKLSPGQRNAYYQAVCRSLGLNPLTRPFEYITLNGKLTLYARRDATDQLRARDRVSVSIVGRERIDDVYVVTARATMPDGRSDESVGAVAIGSLKGDALANALMKAETKAKRRATLSLVGLGWLDETEVETVPGARVIEQSQPEPEAPAALPQPQAEPSGAGFEHWPEGKRRAFWAQARKDDLSDNLIHAAFEVESMKEYRGTVDQARTILGALAYAVKTTIGVAGLTEALGMPVAQAVADGADLVTIQEAVDAYVAEKAGS